MIHHKFATCTNHLQDSKLVYHLAHLYQSFDCVYLDLVFHRPVPQFSKVKRIMANQPLLCSSRKCPYSPPKGDWKFLGGGRGGCLRKSLSVREVQCMDIFWNYTIQVSVTSFKRDLIECEIMLTHQFNCRHLYSLVKCYFL